LITEGASCNKSASARLYGVLSLENFRILTCDFFTYLYCVYMVVNVTCFSRLLSREPKKPPLRPPEAGIRTATPGNANLRASGYVKNHS
jgi:hypothetical protein